MFLSERGCIISCQIMDKHFINVKNEEQLIIRQVCQVLGILNKMFHIKGSINRSHRTLFIENEHLSHVQEKLTTLYQLLTYVTNMTSGNSWQLSGLYTYLPQVIKCLSRFCVAVCDCISADLLLLDNCYQDLVPNILQILSVDFQIPTSEIEGQIEFEALLITTSTKLLSKYHQCIKTIDSALIDKKPKSLIKNNERMILTSKKVENGTVTIEGGGGPDKQGIHVLNSRIIVTSNSKSIQYPISLVWTKIVGQQSMLIITTPVESYTLQFSKKP